MNKSIKFGRKTKKAKTAAEWSKAEQKRIENETILGSMLGPAELHCKTNQKQKLTCNTEPINHLGEARPRGLASQLTF